MEWITFEDFSKIDIRVGTILGQKILKKHANLPISFVSILEKRSVSKDRLLKLQIFML